MQNLITMFTHIILTTLPTLLVAQPGLPGAPEQTGGLGALAALGGAYAIKKSVIERLRRLT